MDSKLAASFGLTAGLVLGSTAGLLLRPSPPPPAPLPSRVPDPAPAPAPAPAPIAGMAPEEVKRLQDGLTDLLVQNRQLQAALATEQKRLISVMEQQGKVTAEIAKSQMEIRRLRAMLTAAGVDPGGAAPAPTKEAAKPKIGQDEPLLAWRVGEAIPDYDATRLVLDEAQRMAADAMLQEEPKRLGDAMRELINRDFPGLLGQGLADKKPEEMLVSMLPKLAPEVSKVQETMAAAAKAGQELPGLWDVLGKDSASWKLAKALASAREATHKDLGRVLSEDQMHHVKRGFLPEHEFRFPGNMNLGFAPLDTAPKPK
jgi:hypothetical protein